MLQRLPLTSADEIGKLDQRSSPVRKFPRATPCAAREASSKSEGIFQAQFFQGALRCGFVA
jgi:hypothetical protein